MLTIRFARVGKKNKAQYKIVVQEHTYAPTGRHAEVLGSHDPHLKLTVLKEERIKYWLEKGAQMSDTVYNLLVTKGIVTGEKRKVKVPKKKTEGEGENVAAEASKAAETAAPAEEKPAAAEAKASKEEVKVEETKAE